MMNNIFETTFHCGDDQITIELQSPPMEGEIFTISGHEVWNGEFKILKVRRRFLFANGFNDTKRIIEYYSADLFKEYNY